SRALEHTFGEFSQLNVGRRGKADELEKSGHALAAVGGSEAEKPSVIIEEVARRQIVIEIGLLGKIAAFPVHGDVVDRFAPYTRCSSRWENQAHEQLQRGGFSGGVWSWKAEDFAVFGAQRKIVERPAHALAPEP